MGKDIVQIYKYNQYQHSTTSIKTPVISFSDSQTSSSIELTITSVPYGIDKNKPILFYVPKILSRMILSITNNDDIQSCVTQRKNYSITTTSTPNYYAHHIASTPTNLVNFHATKTLPPVGKYICILRTMVKLTMQPSILNQG